MLTLRKTALVSIVAVICLYASAAQAQPYYSHDMWQSGYDCVTDNASAQIDYTNGKLVNVHDTSSLIVYCPLPRIGAGGASVIDVTGEMYVIDQHTTSNVSCQMTTKYQTSSGYSYFSTDSSSGNSSTPQQLTFAPSAAWYPGLLFFHCTLPNEASGVYSSAVVSYTAYQAFADFEW